MFPDYDDQDGNLNSDTKIDYEEMKRLREKVSFSLKKTSVN